MCGLKGVMSRVSGMVSFVPSTLGIRKMHESSNATVIRIPATSRIWRYIAVYPANSFFSLYPVLQ